jgi:hypothetical protein
VRSVPLAVAWLDLPCLLRHDLIGMKTISARQAVQQFDEFSKLAHEGHKILVTREGKPWVILAPPSPASRSMSGENELEWPDFEAHWQKHFPEPLAGATATELLAEDKEDRF